MTEIKRPRILAHPYFYLFGGLGANSLFALALALCGPTSPWAADSAKHPPIAAPSGLAAFTWVDELTLVPLSEGGFGPAHHQRIAKDLVRAGGCSEAVAQQVWRAEGTVEGRTDAVRHFLNGAFLPGIEYVVQQVASVGTALSQQDRRAASESLGRALHATQSFYANTNYVELQYEKGLTLAQVPLFEPWRPESKNQLSMLQGEGLISGCDPMLTRPRCQQTRYSRAEIEKHLSSPAGARKLDRWSKNAYQAATELAERASRELVRDVARRFPAYGKRCASPHAVLLVPIAITAKPTP